MAWLSAVIANWRWIGAALIAIALAWAGFWVKGKIDRAAEADRLERVLDETTAAFKESVEAVRKAEAARIRVSQELAEARAKRDVVVKEVVRVIRQAPSDPRCDVSVEQLRLVNRARGYALPEPTE